MKVSELPRIRRELLYGRRIVPCFADRPENVDAMFRSAVAGSADRIALVDGPQRVSFAALDDEVDRVASNLVRRGFAKGERVALLMRNGKAFVVAFLAVARAGLISVPLNTRQRLPEIAFMLGQNRSAAVIVDAEHVTSVPPLTDMPFVKGVFVVGNSGCYPGAAAFADLSEPVGRPEFPAVHQDDTLCLLYTSGTTGAPKGAMLTNVSTLHSVIQFAWAFQLREGDVCFLCVPMSHVTGIVAIMLTSLYVGGTIIVIHDFKARRFLEIASEERITYSLMVPAMYNLCLMDGEFERFDLSTWRVAAFGGAPMPDATIARLADALPGLVLQNVYGATETSSPATILPAGAIVAKPGSVGTPLPLADVIIVDEDGREVAAGESGELLIGGPMVVPGYWDNPNGDAASFIDGHWVSGDIGTKDADGFVWVHDRKKDMINRGGYKVYCTEVENVLLDHPAVIEAAVVGCPDEVLGERVHAYLVLRSNAVTRKEIRAFCGARLSDYKVPDFVTVLDTPLPRNANGKVLKKVLRQTAVVRHRL